MELKLNLDALNNSREMAIPDYMHEGLQGYLLYGWEPGGFLGSVLMNDLIGAFAKADSLNSLRVRNYVMFLYNIAPSDCFGSPKKVADWISYVQGLTDEGREELARFINNSIERYIAFDTAI
jgi:hypothetical protein